MEPPKISLANSNLAPRGRGSILIQQSPNWPCPPVCFLWRPCTSAWREWFAIWNLGRLEGDIHAVTLLEPADHDLDVLLAGAGQQELASLRVAVEAQRLVLFEDAVTALPIRSSSLRDLASMAKAIEGSGSFTAGR